MQLCVEARFVVVDVLGFVWEGECDSGEVKHSEINNSTDTSSHHAPSDVHG